jgi:hypothetical protein
MSFSDRAPLVDGPAAGRVRQCANNRLDAVYSALYSFWAARHTTITAEQQSSNRNHVSRRGYSFWSSKPATATTSTTSTADRHTGGGRRDAYSVVLFSDTSKTVLANDFTSTPDELLDILLKEGADNGTNFVAGLRASQIVMQEHWSAERSPVVIFLSDGECNTPTDIAIRNVCQSAKGLGKPLSFHAVSFGEYFSTTSLRRMADVALEIQNSPAHDVLRPAAPTVPSSFTTALDTVRLTETFLGIAESLRKQRGSLMH